MTHHIHVSFNRPVTSEERRKAEDDIRALLPKPEPCPLHLVDMETVYAALGKVCILDLRDIAIEINRLQQARMDAAMVKPGYIDNELMRIDELRPKREHRPEEGFEPGRLLKDKK